MNEQRLSRDAMMLEMAEVVSRRSTCSRLHVGCIIAQDHRPIVTGYNGAPAGMAHCDHDLDDGFPHDIDGSPYTGCAVAVHAEANAIAYAARQGLKINGATLYCTHEPCYRCSQLIINSGVLEVRYTHPYRLHDGIALLRAARVGVQCGKAED